MCVDSTESQRIISLCTGYGGIELGLRRAGLNARTVCYVEIEAFAITNLVAKIEEGKMDAAPIWTDLKTFPAQIFRDNVHGIIGGYPCQPFSTAGKRKGTKDPRHLWPYIEKHIRTIRPVWCFFENVSGHLTLGFDKVYKSLRSLGYTVEAGLFTAAEVGAPHKRERLFILANSERLGRRRRSNGKYGRQGRPLQTQRPSGLADTDKNEPGTNSRESNSQTDRGNDISGGGGELADTNTSGSRQNRQQCKLRANSTRQPSCDKRNCKTCQKGQRRWPARPGQEQYDWEEPWTVESGMGRTVDGFKSRVDELRLLGNGAVPEEAELAWEKLIEKFIGE